MAKQKLIKRRSTPTPDPKYLSVFNALRQFKGLSEQEAVIFVEILKKKRVSVDDLTIILKSKNIKTTTTKPYAIIKNLIDSDLLFCENKTLRNKIYQPVLPRDLLFDIKDSIEKLDGEVGLLEIEKSATSEVVYEQSEILESDYDITRATERLRLEGYTLEFFHNPAVFEETHPLYKRLIRHDLESKKGRFCMIAARNKNSSSPNIAILLINETPPNKTSSEQKKIVGNKIIDPDVVNSLMKEVTVK